MNVIGIVVEYNPFHNGHKYQIDKVKEMFPNSIIIVAMSGHFTERGEVSVMSKWDKTRFAIENGVDIVLEIPFSFSNQAADKFAYASIKMLNEFKIDTLVFGSESADKETLLKASEIQINNIEFDYLVKENLNKGYNYPTSLSKSIYKFTGINIKESNDILGVSYIKEILKNNYNIEIFPIKRTNNFLDTKDNSNIVSALNIRDKINKNINISKLVPENVDKHVYKVDYEKLFNYLKYKIISEKNTLSKYNLVDEGLENRIYSSIIKSNNYEELINKISTKRYTNNRINRILMNIFIGYTKEDAKIYNEINYLRVLGLSNEGKNYFNKIKKSINLPIYTKFEKELDLELKVTSLYSMIVNDSTLVSKEIKEHIFIK